MRCIVYTDGSFSRTTTGTGIYGAGVFALLEGIAEPIRVSWAEDDPNWSSMNNVAGELKAVMGFVNILDQNFKEYNEIDIYYDYLGVECWVTGEWKARKAETVAYRDIMRDFMDRINIKFHKVVAHASISAGGASGNHEADLLAKAAVREFAEERGLTLNA